MGRLEEMVRIAVPVGSSFEGSGAEAVQKADAQQKGMTRRGFLRGGIALGGTVALTAALGDHQTVYAKQPLPVLEPNFESINDELVQTIAQILHERLMVRTSMATWKREDYQAARSKLRGYGIELEEVLFGYPPNLNKYLIPRRYYVSALNFPPMVIKIFPIMEARDFNSFVDGGGNTRSDVFGFKFGAYTQCLLDYEAYSSHKVAPWGSEGKLDGIGNVVGVPYKHIQGIFRNRPELADLDAEALTMHEIGHSIFRTPYEDIATMVELGYKKEKSPPIRSVDDLHNYLKTRRLTQSKFDRVQLDILFHGNFTHGATIRALKQIAGDLQHTSMELNKIDRRRYPTDVMQISDQQLHATMELLFNRTNISAQYSYR
ncbi:hypothetical protein HYV80_07340 [Candidatus Woesearchaeota archaeon]|nr:hypothetical protein [Candidatus Woesearchaeota archaeon]